MSEDKSKLYFQAYLFQKVCATGAIVAAFMAVMFITSWMSLAKSKGGYGGLDFGRKIFNYHPIFMSSFILFQITAIVTYRVIPLPKRITKPLHGTLHFCGLICLIIGFTCVWVGNNYKDKNDYNTFYSNFTSLHSFLGLGAITMFTQNFLFGAAHFLPSEALVPVIYRQRYMGVHVLLGNFAIYAACFAGLTGIMELFTEIGADPSWGAHACYYDVTRADTNPAAHYHLLSAGCKTANGAGVLIGLAVLLFAISVFDFRKFVVRRGETEYLLGGRQKTEHSVDPLTNAFFAS